MASSPALLTLLRRSYSIQQYSIEKKLKDSSCPQDIKEEILEYIAKIDSRETTMIEWKKSLSELFLFGCKIPFELRCRYNTIITTILIAEKEPNWNEFRMELQRIYQECERKDCKYQNIIKKKLKDAVTHSSCPQDIKEEILEYIAKTEWVKTPPFIAPSSYPFELSDRKYKIISTFLDKKEPNWNEFRMELQRFYKRCESMREDDTGNFINIDVEQLDGKHVALKNVDKRRRVDTLMRKVADETGIPQNEFILSNNNKLLQAQRKLEGYNLRNGSHVQLLPVKKDQSKPRNLKEIVYDIFNGRYGQIMNLVKMFPQFFQDYSRKLSPEDFVNVSQLICDGWQLLGTHLGVDWVKMDQITQDNQTVRVRIVEMLREWERNTPQATAGKLVSAIKACNLKCDFERLKNAILIGI